MPNPQTQAFVPLLVKAGTKPGAYPFHVKAVAKVDGKDVVRYATLTDVVKANLGGMPNPPQELLGGWPREGLIAQIDGRGEFRGRRAHDRIEHQRAQEGVGVALGIRRKAAVVVELDALPGL